MHSAVEDIHSMLKLATALTTLQLKHAQQRNYKMCKQVHQYAWKASDNYHLNSQASLQTVTWLDL